MIRLIDANALLDYAWDADTRCGYVEVVDVGTIEEAPTIDPVKHGKWSSDIPTNSFFKYKCSECGEGQDIKTRFCSGCGAKMDGE